MATFPGIDVGTWWPRTRRGLAAAKRPTAVFASSDEIVTGCLKFIRAAGLKMPGDLSIVGFDDVGQLHLFDLPLTAVRRHVEQLGRRGVEIIVPENRSGTAAAQVERLPVEFVVRSSVAPPANGARTRGRTRRRTAHAESAD